MTAIPPPGSLSSGRHRPKNPTGRPAKVWDDRLREARAKPGEWVQLPGTYTESVAGALRAGRYAGVARGEVETRRRKQASGRFLVWVRVAPDFEQSPGQVAAASGGLWADVNDEGVPNLYVRGEDVVGGVRRYYVPQSIGESGMFHGWGWHDAETAIAALRRMEAAGHLP